MHGLNPPAPAQSPIFIHSLWRSSSTWFFSKFRAAPGYFAYQEPLHEVVVAAASNPDYLQPMSAAAHAELRHPDLGEGHFHELRITHAAWKDHVSASSVYDRYFDPEADHQLLTFYKALIAVAPARPVLQECRTASRIAPIKAALGGVHLALNRNPRDQWWSFKSAAYFEAALQLLLHSKPRPPLLDRIAHNASFTPYLDATIEQRFDHFMRLPLSHEDSYRLFFAVWCLATDHARRHADLVIDLDAFGEVPEVSARVIQSIAELGINGVDLSGFSGFQAPLLPSSLNDFERIEEGVLIDLQIDGMETAALDALRKTLRDKEVIRQSVMAQNGPALALKALDRRENTLFSAQDRERSSALRSMAERDQERGAAAHQLHTMRESFEARNAELVAALESAEQSRQYLQQEQAASAQQLQDSRDQLSRLEQAERALLEQHAQANAHLATLNEELAQRIERITVLETEQRLAQERALHFSAQLDGLTAELNASAIRSAESAAAAEAARLELREVSSQHSASEARVAGLAAEVAALTRELASARETLSQAQQEAAQQAITLATAREDKAREAQETARRIAALEAQLEVQEREGQEAARRIAALDAQLDAREREAQDAALRAAAMQAMLESNAAQAVSSAQRMGGLESSLAASIRAEAQAADQLAKLEALHAQLAERERALAIDLGQARLVHSQVRALRHGTLFVRLRRLLGLPATALDITIDSWTGTDLPPTPHQPTALQQETVAMPTTANPYLRAGSLAELTAWHDLDFVRCAYVTLLGRQPDEAGQFDYVERLRNGAHKLSILSDLRRSDEGQQHDPGIAGLDKALRRHRHGQWPIVRLFTRQEGNSPVERRLRGLSNDIAVMRAVQRKSLESIEALRHDISTLSLPSAMVSKLIAPSEEVEHQSSAVTPNWPHYSAQSVRTLKTLIRGERESS